MRNLFLQFPGRPVLLRFLLTGVLGIPLLQVSSCSGGPPPAQDQAELIETGNAITDALMKNLGTQLKASLAGGDPFAAVQFCAQAATPLTDQTSAEFPTATVRRTSLRFRNPANSPDDIDSQILKGWESQLKEGKPLPEHKLMLIDENISRFYRPIRMQKLCLTCHGDANTFAPELNTVLEKQYPEDLATGFSEGDLRGAFCVEFTQ